MTTQTKSIDQKKLASRPASTKIAQRSAKSPRGGARELTTPTITAAAPAAKSTKRDQLAALLLRDEGATLDQMIAATGWLPHTTRAALTGLKKLGYAIDSDKIDGIRTYRAVAPK